VFIQLGLGGGTISSLFGEFGLCSRILGLVSVMGNVVAFRVDLSLA
jgi:hypothetical protein